MLAQDTACCDVSVDCEVVELIHRLQMPIENLHSHTKILRAKQVSVVCTATMKFFLASYNILLTISLTDFQTATLSHLPDLKQRVPQTGSNVVYRQSAVKNRAYFNITSSHCTILGLTFGGSAGFGAGGYSNSKRGLSLCPTITK